MSTRDKRVDAYIAKSAEFARPILEHCRELVHATCPEVTESIKWGVPAFEYHGLLANLAAFKQHCSFGFWKHALVVGSDGGEKPGYGSFGKLTELKDLPSKRELTRYMKKAMKLNESGDTSKREKAGNSSKCGRAKAELSMHPGFKRALAANKPAKKHFDAFAPGYQREYLEWIDSAKRETTREKRIIEAVEWLAEGKRRNWKYC